MFNKAINQNRIFGIIAAGTAALLCVPLVAMQLTSHVNWTMSDFAIAGVVLFGFASAFVLVAPRTNKKHRLLIGILFAALFIYVWAELAVGIFTDLGS